MYRLNPQVTAYTDDKLSLIGAWSGQNVTHYKILGLQSYHWNG